LTEVKKKPLRRPRCKWEDTINMDMKIGWEDVNWIHLVEGSFWRWAVVNTEMNLQVP
jgi:hypothetical protein